MLWFGLCVEELFFNGSVKLSFPIFYFFGKTTILGALPELTVFVFLAQGGFLFFVLIGRWMFGFLVPVGGWIFRFVVLVQGWFL